MTSKDRKMKILAVLGEIDKILGDFRIFGRFFQILGGFRIFRRRGNPVMQLVVYWILHISKTLTD